MEEASRHTGGASSAAAHRNPHGSRLKAVADLERRIGEFKAFAGTLGASGGRLRAALEAHDAIGQLSYRVWYFPSLTHDQDQRDNASAARRQR